MITEVKVGELFESEAHTLVNTVNCVGVMGKGIALKFKERFPKMFKDYVERCRHKHVKLGKPYPYKSLVLPWVINFPTKEHWRSTSHIEDIIKGLEYIVKHYKKWGIKSLAVPPLGCGQGRLDWETVGPILYRYLNELNIPVQLYAPYGTSPEQVDLKYLASRAQEMVLTERSIHVKSLEPAWVALVEILRRIEEEPYHWPIGRTIFQKIAYVATQEGLPTGLRYRKGTFGPFSPKLREVITKLVNSGLISEERLGRMFTVKVGPGFEDCRNEHLGEFSRWEHIIKKVTDLFMRMHTQRSEIVATVLFAARTSSKEVRGNLRETELLEHVMKWKQRRRPQLDEGEVAYTIRNLAALGWLDVKPSHDLPIPEVVDV
jgi:O-acetyl-ADP-ribose deacetylase (regulator of RNase III)/uncharacterized protein YwgA